MKMAVVPSLSRIRMGSLDEVESFIGLSFSPIDRLIAERALRRYLEREGALYCGGGACLLFYESRYGGYYAVLFGGFNGEAYALYTGYVMSKPTVKRANKLIAEFYKFAYELESGDVVELTRTEECPMSIYGRCYKYGVGLRIAPDLMLSLDPLSPNVQDASSMGGTSYDIDLRLAQLGVYGNVVTRTPFIEVVVFGIGGRRLAKLAERILSDFTYEVRRDMVTVMPPAAAFEGEKPEEIVIVTPPYIIRIEPALRGRPLRDGDRHIHANFVIAPGQSKLIVENRWRRRLDVEIRTNTYVAGRIHWIDYGVTHASVHNRTVLRFVEKEEGKKD